MRSDRSCCAANRSAQAALHARLTVANFSPAAQTLQGRDHRRRQGGRQCPGASGARRNRRNRVSESRAGRRLSRRAEPADGFALDNVAWRHRRRGQINFDPVRDSEPCRRRRPDGLPGISVRVASPRAYSPKDLATADLAIFEYAVPKELPAVNTLLVMPPAGGSGFRLQRQPTAKVEITGWPPTDALTDGVNFRLLNLRCGEYLGQHPWMPGDGHRQRRRADARGRALRAIVSSPWASIRFPISAGKICRCRC